MLKWVSQFSKQSKKPFVLYLNMTVYDERGIDSYVLCFIIITTAKILSAMTFERFGGS